MTQTTQQNIRGMVYAVHNNDFSSAKRYIRSLVREKIQYRYQGIARKIVEGKDK